CIDNQAGQSSPSYGTCALQGKSGTCIPVSSCGVGYQSVRGLCSGPSYIQCCLPAVPPPPPASPPAGPVSYGTCTISTTKGNCIPPSACSTMGGTSHGGHCSGDSDIQCCIVDSTYGQCTGTNGSFGECINVASCPAIAQAGLCPGP